MKKFTKNRKVVGVACLVFAFITCFILAPAIVRKEDEKVGVVRVKSDIKKGDIITAENLVEIPVYNKNVPTNMVMYEDLESIEGTYATTDLYSNETLLYDHITESNSSNYSYLDELNAENFAVSVNISSFEKGLSDKLQAGDIVRVYATNYNDLNVVSPQELKYVKVLAVTEESGFDNNELSKEEYETTLSVTLQVNDAQAMKVIDLNANSDVQLALVYRGNTENSNKFLDLQKSMNGGN